MELLKRGGVSRGIYEFDELKHISWLLGVKNDLTELGQEARLIDQLPVKMLVFDGKAVMFALDEPRANNDDLTMIVIEHRSVANACKILFNHLWLQAEEFENKHRELITTLSENDEK